MSEWTIRPAEAADMAAVAAIYAEAVRFGTATFELDPPDEPEMTRRWRGMSERGYPYLVATGADGAIAGYAYAGPYRERPAYRFTVEDSIYLDAASRGRGLGSTLLAALVGAATRQGFRQMLAVIGDSGNAASVRLHARAGFTPTGTFRSVGWKHARWLDTVLMQRPLGPGDSIPPDRPEPAVAPVPPPPAGPLQIVHLDGVALLVKRPGRDWRGLQDEFHGYRTSLAFDDAGALIAYLDIEYGADPDRAQRLRAFAASRETVMALSV